MDARKKFATRICPTIICRACDVNRSRGNEANQLVLIHRTGIDAFAVVCKVVTEPVREGVVDDLDRFAELSSMQSGTSTS